MTKHICLVIIIICIGMTLVGSSGADDSERGVAGVSLDEAQRIVGKAMVTGQVHPDECAYRIPCEELWSKMGAQVFEGGSFSMTRYVIQRGQLVAMAPITGGVVADLNRDGQFEFIYIADGCSGCSCPGIGAAPLNRVMNRAPQDRDCSASLKLALSADGTFSVKNSGHSIVGVIRYNNAQNAYEVEWKKEG